MIQKIKKPSKIGVVISVVLCAVPLSIALFMFTNSGVQDGTFSIVPIAHADVPVLPACTPTTEYYTVRYGTGYRSGDDAYPLYRTESRTRCMTCSIQPYTAYRSGDEPYTAYKTVCN